MSIRSTFLWAAGLFSPTFAHFAGYEAHKPLGTSYSKAVICLKFQPFLLLLLFTTHTLHSGYFQG